MDIPVTVPLSQLVLTKETLTVFTFTEQGIHVYLHKFNTAELTTP